MCGPAVKAANTRCAAPMVRDWVAEVCRNGDEYDGDQGCYIRPGAHGDDGGLDGDYYYGGYCDGDCDVVRTPGFRSVISAVSGGDAFKVVDRLNAEDRYCRRV